MHCGASIDNYHNSIIRVLHLHAHIFINTLTLDWSVWYLFTEICRYCVGYLYLKNAHVFRISGLFWLHIFAIDCCTDADNLVVMCVYIC